MKKQCLSMLVAVLAIVSFSAHANDRKLMMPIADGLAMPETKEKLAGDVKFFFGSKDAPTVLQNFGENVSNRKTNAFMKTDKSACDWAFLSALISLEQYAHQVGANAVINIVSYYDKDPVDSATEFECHAGGVMAGVALKGTFVKISDK